MKRNDWIKDHFVELVSSYVTASLLIASLLAACYTGLWADYLPGFLRIITTPTPLVTDSFALGNLPASLLNMGLCGLGCTLAFWIVKPKKSINTLSSFFLVLCHSGYGLTCLNMWPMFFGVMLFCLVRKQEVRVHLDTAFFAAAMGPFVGEFLFRYPGNSFVQGQVQVSLVGLGLVLIVALVAGFVGPPMVAWHRRIHKGYTLYNAGFAMCLIGLPMFAFFFKTLGLEKPPALVFENAFYAAHGYCYKEFILPYCLIMFALLILAGWWMNGRSFRGYGEILKTDALFRNFPEEFDVPRTLINIGCMGLVGLSYLTAVIFLTDGAGVTGITTGAIFATCTFAHLGQQPKIVWPMLLGYVALSGLVHVICLVAGMEVPWTLSTQLYINGSIFSMGLCPVVARYGWKAGVVGGMLSSIMCTSTAVIHGGFVLYNNGFTAGLAGFFLVPVLEYYWPEKKFTPLECYTCPHKKSE